MRFSLALSSAISEACTERSDCMSDFSSLILSSWVTMPRAFSDSSRWSASVFSSLYCSCRKSTCITDSSRSFSWNCASARVRAVFSSASFASRPFTCSASCLLLMSAAAAVWLADCDLTSWSFLDLSDLSSCSRFARTLSASPSRDDSSAFSRCRCSSRSRMLVFSVRSDWSRDSRSWMCSVDSFFRLRSSCSWL